MKLELNDGRFGQTVGKAVNCGGSKSCPLVFKFGKIVAHNELHRWSSGGIQEQIFHGNTNFLNDGNGHLWIMINSKSKNNPKLM